MPQATVSETVMEPALADVVNVRIAGDLNDPGALRIYAQVVLKDDQGAEWRRDTVEVELTSPQRNGLQSQIANAILPQIVAAVEAKLGITFA